MSEAGGWDDWGERADLRGRAQWRTLLSADLTDSAEISLGIARIAPGEELAPHRHEQAEGYIVLAGTASIELDGTEHEVGPGEAFFVPGNAVHACRNRGEEELRFAFAFAVDSMEEVSYDFGPAGEHPPSD